MVLACAISWCGDCFGLEQERKYTLDDVEASVRKLQQCVQNDKIDEVRPTFEQLRAILQSLNSQYEQKTCSDKPSLYESGDEVCGDDYTEFVMLLNIILAPIRQEPIASKIKKYLQVGE